MASKDDELWWQYFAECSRYCGLPLPSRVPETAAVMAGYVFAMMQAWDASGKAGSMTAGRFFTLLARKSPAAYAWIGRTMPGLLRAAFARGISGGVTGTVVLEGGAGALTVGEAGVLGAGMLASAYLGYVIGAAMYASLRLRGFDLGAEGSTASDFFAWQQGNNGLSFMDWWGGALAADQQGEDLQNRLATRKARAIQALAAAERSKGIRVPNGVKSAIRAI